MSPWTDLTHSFPSFAENISTDYLPDARPDTRMLGRKQYYAPNDALNTKFVSPIHGDFTTCPILIQVGGAERLRDEGVALAYKCDDATLEVYDSHCHVFQMFGFAVGSRVALNRAAKWMKALVEHEDWSKTVVEKRNGGVTRIDYKFDGTRIVYARK